VIQIVTGDARPVFRQIVDGIRMKIATGELLPGTRLPSLRSLALQVMVNPNTVAKAYAQLTAEGVIESRHGVGVFVREPRQRLSGEEQERRLDEAIQQLVRGVVSLDFSPEEILERLGQRLEALKAKEPTESD